MLDLEDDADLAALLERGRPHEVEHVAQQQHRLLSSNDALVGRSFGSRSRQRSVASSSQVKSSVNQPVSSTPSTVFVVRRSANSGRVADIGRRSDLVLVPHDEHAVAR